MRKIRRYLHVPGWLLLVVFATSFALGQGGSRGAITGTVKDQMGAVVPGAKIQVIHEDTGTLERTLTSSADGSFNATLLPIGKYRLTVTATGFAKTEAPGIDVRLAEITTIPLVLKPGTVTTELTVLGAAAEVQLASAATGETIVANTVNELPLSTRNFLTLLTLSSGANTEMFDSAALGRGQVTMNVNGMRPSNNNYQLEGINANDFNLPVLDNVALPNPSTIAEFKTQTSLYDASQGRNGGGNIQVAMKSGTDKYHGDAYEFFRNNVLNANDWFLKRSEFETDPTGALNKQPILKQNQFGASLGGPVPGIKNFFFFGNYQGTREASGIATGTTINASTIPVLPTDRSAANLLKTFFPDGLPAGYTQLDPTAVNWLNLPASKCPGFNDGTFCIPTVAGTPGFADGSLNTGGLSLSSPGAYNEDQFTIALDKNIRSSDKVTGRWFYDQFAVTRPYGGNSTLAFPLSLPQTNRFLKIGETHVFSPKAVNEFRFGFNRLSFAIDPTEPVSLADIGATRPNEATFPAAYRIAISGFFSIGTAVNDDRGLHSNGWVLADDFSLTKGKHTLRIGGEWDKYQLNRYNNFQRRGTMSFTSSSSLGIDAFQDFLLGRITGSQYGSGIATRHFRATDYSAYFQDDWKATSRLTLNLGLRWEGLSTAHEIDNLMTNLAGFNDGASAPPLQFIHPAGFPTFGTSGVTSCTLLHCLDSNNFGPRVGFAWDFLGNAKTVLRGGYGIYYMRTSNQALLQTSTGLPFEQSLQGVPPGNMANSFTDMLPASAFPLKVEDRIPKLVAFDGTSGAPIFDSADGAANSGLFFQPVRNFRAPYSQNWNLNIQQEVARGWIAEIGYVGSRGVALIGPGRPLNAAQICTAAQPCLIPASVGANVTVPAGTPFVTKFSDGAIAITGNSTDNVDARVPVTFLGTANNGAALQENNSQSVYHSLQSSLVHQFANGLYFQAAYTYSRSIDNGSGSSFSDEVNGLWQFGNLLNIHSNRGLSDFDRTHRFVISYNYELPFAKMLGVTNHGLGKLVNGWAINGLTTFQSGTPFIVIDSSSVSWQDPTYMEMGLNFAALQPGAVMSDVYKSTPDCKVGSIDCYINLAPFQAGGLCVNAQNNLTGAPTTGNCASGISAIGNVGRNTFRGPFQQNWDMSLVKETKITESTGLEFRAEFFNIWNHPAFQSPQSYGDFFGNYGMVDVSGGSSAITGTVNRPRIIQFAMRFHF